MKIRRDFPKRPTFSKTTKIIFVLSGKFSNKKLNCLIFSKKNPNMDQKVCLSLEKIHTLCIKIPKNGTKFHFLKNSICRS